MLRVILILPILFIPAAAGMTWALLYDGEVGLINHFLRSIGLKPKMWLASGSTGFPAVMITDIWAWTPFSYLILLAGLQSLPTEPFEAAEVDGASSLQRFWHLTLPMMKPIIAIVTVIRSLHTFRTFVFIWTMTRGGPGDSTQVMSTLIFVRAFRNFRYGLGSTMAVITLLIAVVLSLFLIALFKERAR
jgi:multiple sugar transport system permease protein